MIARASLLTGLERLIGLGERLCRLPDVPLRGEEQIETVRALWQLAAQRIVGVRLPLLSQASGDLARAQESALTVGEWLLGEGVLSLRQQLVLEYELSFFGVRPFDALRCVPSVFHYLDTGSRDLQVGTQGRTAHPIRDMADFELQRIQYSLDARFGDAGLDRWIEGGPATDERISAFLVDKRRILEVGFLHQHLYRRIRRIAPDVAYVGADCSLHAVVQARKLGIDAVHCNAWFALPFPDQHFDGIVAFNIEERDGLWVNREFHRVLRPGGDIWVDNPYNPPRRTPVRLPSGRPDS